MNDSTLLHRVVNSNYVHGGKVSSQAFRPRSIGPQTSIGL